MPGEKNFKKKVIEGLRGKVLFQKHEDSFSPGIPDLSYDIKGIEGSGWIEMKRKAEWPVRPGTMVQVPGFSLEQRNWLSKHGDYNKRCYLFIQIDKEHMLFSHDHVHKIGNLNMNDLIKLSLGHWEPIIDYKELYEILRYGYGSQKGHKK